MENEYNMTDTSTLSDSPHDHVDETIYLLLFLALVGTLNIWLVVCCRLDRLRLLDQFSLVSSINSLNKLCHYLANLATMILIDLLCRRFDNLLRTISEIVAHGIVLAIREREKQDKKVG
jgi:hypothetical protein